MCESSMCGSTNKSHYYVVFDGAWKIQCDGENSEPYEHRRDALKDAVALAHLDVRNGREADVIVQCRDDTFRPEWDSTRDVYPPPLAPEYGASSDTLPVTSPLLEPVHRYR